MISNLLVWESKNEKKNAERDSIAGAKVNQKKLLC